MKVIIIGGVAGGASCAARLRRMDENAQIIMLERGEYISFANCGLPYHVSGVIKERSALLLQTPEQMQKKYNVDVRVKNEVVSVDPSRKTITVKRLGTESGELYEESYDKLVISTGSSPLRPPIQGIDSPKIHTLWTVPDTDKIKELVKDAKSAAVIGGGFIGLEMAENLRHAGLEVSVIEMLDQVMAPLDFEMAQLLHQHLFENGVKLYLGDGVDKFEDLENAVKVTTKSGKTITSDLVILSIGVRPNGELAKNAGLTVNARGGIVVNNRMQTSNPDIYAVGDVVEIEDFIFKSPTMIPLAGPANKQGRIAADNIAGLDVAYGGTQGSSVAKIFDLTAACTGANEKTLKKRGLEKGKDYQSAIIIQNSHAGYYPGAVPMTLKLIFAADGSKLFGAQAVGRDGVDKRIDTLSAVMRMNGKVSDLKEMEFSYAPPYSSAKDPVNMAGFVADNIMKGLVHFCEWDDVEKTQNALLLDVREPAEVMAYAVPDTVNIPLGQLRSRLNQLDKTKTVIVFCAIGVRAYNAARILMQNGFENVLVYPGGSRFYQSTHYIDDNTGCPASSALPDIGSTEKAEIPVAAIRLDCSGMQCPGPIMKVFETIGSMKNGEMLEVSASDPGFVLRVR